MITLEIDRNSSRSLYVQLYEYLRGEILSGRIHEGEKLPSLRSMAVQIGVSITTVKIAYEQLLVEGYVISKPNSGYYASQGAGRKVHGESEQTSHESIQDQPAVRHESVRTEAAPAMSCDPESFDFVKWKKCMASVLNETPEMLLSEADRQGEPALRREIASYLYTYRGVECTEDQVVISAGTQQLVNHLARIIKMMDIWHICTEEPGYLPVRNIFRDWGFGISNIPVHQNGIEIEKLPVNIRTAVYVCPQNQFPTGAVMPISRRHKLLEWAAENDSIIIEDDYNSELKYFGMPIPALQGLDHGSRVVYIGSFTSTLFPAVRISYMVLPRNMTELYSTFRTNYDQTCSKTEQLTLALFMQRGYYQTNLKKVKKLYSRKLDEVLQSIREFDPDGSFIAAENSDSGIHIILRVNTEGKVSAGGAGVPEGSGTPDSMMIDKVISEAASRGIKLRRVDQLSHDGQLYLMFYYNQIPLGNIREAVIEMISCLKAY